MNEAILQYITAKLQERKDEYNFRSLRNYNGLIDFYSNDYLGFAGDEELNRRVLEEIKSQTNQLGSTGSRLLSGNSKYAEQLESYLASFYNAENALIFNSGFNANYGLLSSLPYRGDTIIYDELVHASIHDGIRNSKANAISFFHNNISELESKLKVAAGLKYVVVESVYSMDGDFAPLKEMVALCEKYEAGLIVDEAHAGGIFGKNGSGLATQLGIESKCLARIHTFGKALGVHGAAVLCSAQLKDFLINYCRPFIFSTALPFHSLAAIKCAHEYLKEADERRKKISALIQVFKNSLNKREAFEMSDSLSPVQSIIIKGNEQVVEIAEKLRENGFDVRPIKYPTVAKGKERLRVCLHSFNTEEEVIKLAQQINSL